MRRRVGSNTDLRSEWGFTMASPQLENGYTQIANEIVERLSYPGINGSEYRVLLLVIRKTYGFKKKQDRISLTQFQKFTLMERKQAVETIKSLLEKKILLKQGGVFMFNKNYHEWVVGKRPLATGSGQKTTIASGQKPTKSSGQKPTHKRKKETITKETSKTDVLRGEEWNNLIDLFKEVNPFYTEFYRNTTERRALSDLVKKIGFEKLRATITHLPEVIALPYAPKITKPSELKRDLGKLIAFYKQHQAKLPTSNVYEV